MADSHETSNRIPDSSQDLPEDYYTTPIFLSSGDALRIYHSPPEDVEWLNTVLEGLPEEGLKAEGVFKMDFLPMGEQKAATEVVSLILYKAYRSFAFLIDYAETTSWFNPEMLCGETNPEMADLAKRLGFDSLKFSYPDDLQDAPPDFYVVSIKYEDLKLRIEELGKKKTRGGKLLMDVLEERYDKVGGKEVDDEEFEREKEALDIETQVLEEMKNEGLF